ncbi:thiol-disulfide isomerase [Synechocystis sp. FACHB-383]|uniref:circadian clock KaiB family protein n=1 Tax=Synechocystis sp. FACHB-383 TaxID=2692864 RepID=UPI001684031A|nr:circadian clock KaiB family protein [Synechocystis sp. FACHB-383]MBD2654707.1 thiol-disulfide isomerase [Synechocystis sp. FACHB-383]
MTDPEDSKPTIKEVFEQFVAESEEQYYVLRLYIAGNKFQSLKALQNIEKICEEYLHGRHEIEVIDVYQQTEEVVKHNIIVVPTLVKERPLPTRKIIGNLSDTQKVLMGLDIIPRPLPEKKR